jgi:hypothetical protein
MLQKDDKPWVSRTQHPFWSIPRLLDSKSTGGEGGIRTPDTLSGMPVFKTGAINHSATSPQTAAPRLV